MNFKDRVESHNLVDIITGLLMIITVYLIGDVGMVFLSLLILHIFIRKEVDEREKMIISRAYAYAFHILIGLMAIFYICCAKIVTPMFVIGLSIFLRGLVGALLFKFY